MLFQIAALACSAKLRVDELSWSAFSGPRRRSQNRTRVSILVLLGQFLVAGPLLDQLYLDLGTKRLSRLSGQPFWTIEEETAWAAKGNSSSPMSDSHGGSQHLPPADEALSVPNALFNSSNIFLPTLSIACPKRRTLLRAAFTQLCCLRTLRRAAEEASHKPGRASSGWPSPRNGQNMTGPLLLKPGVLPCNHAFAPPDRRPASQIASTGTAATSLRQAKRNDEVCARHCLTTQAPAARDDAFTPCEFCEDRTVCICRENGRAACLCRGNYM